MEEILDKIFALRWLVVFAAFYICMKLNRNYKLMVHIGMMISKRGMLDYFEGKKYNQKDGYHTEDTKDQKEAEKVNISW